MAFVVRALDMHTVLLDERAWIDNEGGAPLRCCLRDSQIGERLRLGAVTPPGPAGAYRETGPVFLHAGDCGGPSTDTYPEAFRSRGQVFRAYDYAGAICGGLLVAPGQGQEQAAGELLADPHVAFLHSRNVVFGCYMFAMYRR